MKGTRKNTIVFLGGGRITGALLAGLRLANYNQPIVVHDRHSQKLRQLKVQYGVKVEPNLRRAVERCHPASAQAVSTAAQSRSHSVLVRTKSLTAMRPDCD